MAFCKPEPRFTYLEDKTNINFGSASGKQSYALSEQSSLESATTETGESISEEALGDC